MDAHCCPVSGVPRILDYRQGPSCSYNPVHSLHPRKTCDSGREDTRGTRLKSHSVRAQTGTQTPRFRPTPAVRSWAGSPGTVLLRGGPQTGSIRITCKRVRDVTPHSHPGLLSRSFWGQRPASGWSGTAADAPPERFLVIRVRLGLRPHFENHCP